MPTAVTQMLDQLRLRVRLGFIAPVPKKLQQLLPVPQNSQRDKRAAPRKDLLRPVTAPPQDPCQRALGSIVVR